MHVYIPLYDCMLPNITSYIDTDVTSFNLKHYLKTSIDLVDRCFIDSTL